VGRVTDQYSIRTIAAVLILHINPGTVCQDNLSGSVWNSKTCDVFVKIYRLTIYCVCCQYGMRSPFFKNTGYLNSVFIQSVVLDNTVSVGDKVDTGIVIVIACVAINCAVVGGVDSIVADDGAKFDAGIVVAVAFVVRDSTVAGDM